MTTATSVVTPERYDTGLKSFAEWMRAIDSRHEEFQKHYDEYTPNGDDVAAIKALVASHGARVLVLGEGWCPDVWRGVPVVARMAEATGMTARYFLRDENKDIMSEFLKQGEFESIPTVVFYDGTHNHLGTWIERPVEAMDDMARLRKEILDPAPQEDGPERTAARAAYSAATTELRGNWRHASLREMRALLENALK